MTNSDEVRKYFDHHVESEWGRLADSFHGRIKYRIHREVLARHLPDGGRVLDAGCGPGRFAVDLVRDGYSVVLADLSQAQLDAALKHLAAEGLEEGIEGAHRLDIVDLSLYDDESFDAVVCFGGALSYAGADAPRAIAEFVRVARPGAPVLVSAMSLWGTLRFGAVLDADAVFAAFESHFDVEAGKPLPEWVATVPDSPEFHAPMACFTGRSLRQRLEEAGLEVVEMATSNSLSTRDGLTKIGENPAAADRFLRYELQAAFRPELLDSGEHVIAAARRRRD